MFTGAKIHSTRCAEVRKNYFEGRGEIQATGLTLTIASAAPRGDSRAQRMPGEEVRQHGQDRGHPGVSRVPQAHSPVELTAMSVGTDPAVELGFKPAGPAGGGNRAVGFPIPAEVGWKAKEGAGTPPWMACTRCRMSSRERTHFSCRQIHVPGTELHRDHPQATLATLHVSGGQQGEEIWPDGRQQRDSPKSESLQQ